MKYMIRYQIPRTLYYLDCTGRQCKNASVFQQFSDWISTSSNFDKMKARESGKSPCNNELR
jgi:hypothetical protein